MRTALKFYFCLKNETLNFIFLGSYCFIQDLVHWNTIGLGRESRGLYLLQQHTLSTKPHSVLATSFDSHSFTVLIHTPSKKVEFVE